MSKELRQTLQRDSLHDRALRALIAGRHAEARQHINALLFMNREDAGAYALAGRLAAETGEFAQELDYIKRALAIAPANPDYMALLGKCYGRTLDMQPAIEWAEKAEASAQLSELTLDAIAAIYTRFGFHSRAAGCLKRATATGTLNPAIHFNLGTSLKFCGDFNDARAAFERAIELAPGYHKAHAALTSLGGITSEHNHLDRLSSLINQTADPRACIHLCHAASKECEALDRYDAAFDYLNMGKAGLRKALGATTDNNEALVDRLIRRFSETKARGGFPTKQPVFVVGMPRSGTTLVDRIISNHSKVSSIGESQHFGQLLKQISHSQTRELLDDRMLDTLDADLTGVGKAYVQRGLHVAGGSERFVDKFHLNIYLAGHIARALPNARIVCIVRNPLDTIVSNFRQLFEFNTPIYRYALDLEATARFYIQFRRLANFWQSQLPHFHTVEYEDLVENTQMHIRNLLTFCDLEWEERCLHIETNTAPVATASAVQVRQPINRASIGNWRKYDAHLTGVKSILTKAGYTV